MKKSTTFGLIATVALTLAPLSAFAQSVNNQHSVQGGVQTNATVGAGNSSQQLGITSNYQDQINLNGSHSPAVNSQYSQQQLLQESAVLGEYNQGLQVGDFTNTQSQINVQPQTTEYQYYPDYAPESSGY
jgi:hypothetical protein